LLTNMLWIYRLSRAAAQKTFKEQGDASGVYADKRTLWAKRAEGLEDDRLIENVLLLYAGFNAG